MVRGYSRMSVLAIVAMTKSIRVKFLSKSHEDQIEALWSPLIPHQGFENIEFTFDANDSEYDFLVTYEGLPKWQDRPVSKRLERLSCSRQNTLLITTEPSSIRIDGPHFMRQFGHILTSKSPQLTRHPNHIAETPPLRWFYGRSFDETRPHLSFDELADQLPLKTKTLSTVCSQKRMSHTVHAARLNFVTTLQDHLSELEVFGRGLRPISDKADAMRDYRYHIAIENHIEPGHWTEKLADCFLAGCLPFYFGDPDYAKIFPKQAVIPINIFDFEAARKTIQQAIHEDAFTERRVAIAEARKIVLQNYNTLGWVSRFVTRNFNHETGALGDKIYGRHAFRKHHPIKALSDLKFRTQMKRLPIASPLQFELTNSQASEP